MARREPGRRQFRVAPVEVFVSDFARTGQKGRQAAAILKKVYGLDRNADLFVAGYSRGASAAIIAAETLQKDGIVVKAMFLFDPVARHMCSGGEVIPANVRRAYVAYRALDADIVAKEDMACQEAVAGFMNDAMDVEGLKGVRLTSITPIV